MNRRSRASRGFVLVLTLWVLAAVAIAAGFFGERVQASLRLAAAGRDLAQAQIALANTQAEVLYRLGTSPMSPWGLGDRPNTILLDGRLYAESGGTVELQDAAGLVNLNAFADDAMGRFLATMGVPANRHAMLIDTLRDYVDADGLRRLNGAESTQYGALGRPDLPRNAPLLSPPELRDVSGWSEQPGLWRAGGVLEFATTEGSPRLNPNTAPWQVLTALPGVTPDIAQLIIARRELQPVDAAWVDRLLGTQFDTMLSPLQTFPSNQVRVTQRAPGLPWTLRYNVELTPNGSKAPWKISFFYRLESVPQHPEPTDGPRKNTVGTPTPSLDSPTHANDPPQFPPRASQPASAPFFLPG